MNRTSVLGRKLIYLVVLVAMLVPLYLLGQPAGGRGDGGGHLTEMRHKYNIAEADLGEISPASETMKLASLGLRGVAATLLWNKAHEYRILHEWDRLKATLNNIALLQPHYDKVWEHQAHNLAYNVSIEFDDYRQRYEMVREGTEYLTRGVRQNKNAPRLIWYTGWFYGQKMGMSDEKTQFRKLFADDEVLHKSLDDEGIPVYTPDARGPLGKPDNWLVGRLWLNHGYEKVDGGVKIRRQTPINFFETGPKWRMKHAEAIESEGILDYRAQRAWELAFVDWENFGKRSIPTTARFTIKLGSLEELVLQRDELREKFVELTGDAYKAEERKILATLPKDLMDVYNRSPEERTEAGQKAMEDIEVMMLPKLSEVAKAADKNVRLEASNLINQMADLTARINKTTGYRTQINYSYWLTLALAEQEKRTVEARKKVYDAEEANSKARLEEAIALYEESFEIWAEIFDDYPILTLDDTAEDLFQSIRKYMRLRDTEEMPEDFPLKTFAMMMGTDGRVNSRQYAVVRDQQKAKAAKRKQELAEEERRLEAEASKKNAPDATSDPKDEMKLDAAKKTDDAEKTESKDSKPAPEDPVI